MRSSGRIVPRAMILEQVWHYDFEGNDNVLYPMRDALRARATVGEVCNALREVWGVYVPSARV